MVLAGVWGPGNGSWPILSEAAGLAEPRARVRSGPDPAPGSDDEITTSVVSVGRPAANPAGVTARTASAPADVSAVVASSTAPLPVALALGRERFAARTMAR